MSAAQLWCEPTGSIESPIALTPRRSNSGFERATYPSSVVHTGVKSQWVREQNRPAVADPFVRS